MRVPSKNAPAAGRRTLGEKLKRLRDMKAPPGEPPPSYEITARQITETTGVSISGPYFWELVTGRTTNPKLHHLQALARFYGVPVAYLVDEQADFEQLESELELLHALKRGGVRDIKLEGFSGPGVDISTIQSLLGKLRLLDDFGDDETRETALRLKSLDPAHQTELLDALENDHVRELALAANALAEDRITTAVGTISQSDLLDALAEDDVRRAARSLTHLTPASRQAVLALIDHLREVEGGAEG
ncbi:helix-turn-helix domain-containing protein [Streptomyces litchfieldiae]|uniref:Helix-turn-helix transcriptional regulator n=1 Tax=Streptomyces litchfieldiae TaxID=3075543 RepID=A0ABU2MMK4_9ACTN|nr:helix-turn-helix transcriptional regulator [Streptomyces sp. DSM 44938]MDT0342706.1 helix-turn-helix transcriptional regulator [Streptomyces sp. DSM 44938]